MRTKLQHLVRRWRVLRAERYLGFLQESHRNYEPIYTHVLRRTLPVCFRWHGRAS
jgi:hypothetical protein